MHKIAIKLQPLSYLKLITITILDVSEDFIGKKYHV